MALFYLQDNIARALSEFKRDKISRQNARLSLANAVYENPTMPRRKIMLSIGGNNYRPPLERSKSAPKLGAIEEIIGEEDEDDEENGENEEIIETRQCCKDDHLFPAMTLGRRRCRRGHSIRKVMRRSPAKKQNSQSVDEKEIVSEKKPDRSSLISNSSEDDFVNILMKHEYNSSEPLEGEIMSYFDLTLRPKTKSLIDLHEPEDEEQLSLMEMRRNSQSLDDLDAYSDIEGGDSPENVFFNQDDILDIIRRSHHNNNENETDYARHSLTHMTNPGIHDLVEYDLQLGQSYNRQITNDSAMGDCDENRDPPSLISNSIHLNGDSDEGSISSGCETSSTVTNNNEESHKSVAGALNRENNIRTIMHQPATIERKAGAARKRVEFHRNVMTIQAGERKYSLSHSIETNDHDSDSEFSDESGYVEEQEINNRNCIKTN